MHIAHLIIAQRFAEEFALEKCFFVPAYISPFKTEDNDVGDILPEDRTEMLRIAIKDNPLFEIETFEIEQKGVSYTIKTIDHFSRKYPDSAIHLLIGTDQAVEFDKWHKATEILAKVDLCVARRPGLDSDGKIENIKKMEIFSGKKPVFFDGPLLEISATEIRRRAKKGASIKYIVPRKVEKFIMKNNLYR